MSTRTARRSARQPKTTQVAYRLTTGSWGAVQNPPDFGPETPPDAERTVRVVKDVLKVGRWPVGNNPDGSTRYWNVTAAVLANIAKNFRTMANDGDVPNLGKTHGDAETLLIHPDDLMAEIADVKVAGDTLWMASYVTPEEAKYLQNPARKVSIGALENYENAKRKYAGDSLLHVAVTDRPVYIGQGSFMAMANGNGGSSMNPELLDAINVLMEAAGLGKLENVADEAALIEQLKGVAAALGQSTSTEEPPTEGGGMPEGEAMNLPLPGVPAPMAKSIREAITLAMSQQTETIKTLQADIKSRDDTAKKLAKDTFDAQCVKLLASGVTKVAIDGKKALAATYGHDLRLLDGLAPTLNTGGNAKRLSNPGIPPTEGGKASDDDERESVAQDIHKRTGKPIEVCRKLVP